MQHRSWLVAAIGAAVIGGGALLYHSLDRPPRPSAQWQVLDQYCVGCHNDDDLAGGVSFLALDRHDLGKNAEIWETAVRKLRTGVMPPKGERRPARAVLDATAGWLESELDDVWAKAPNPGTKALARLNRTGYANAIRDLLAYEPGAIVASLPADVSVAGFDNIAAALDVSPTLLEGYAQAAMQISRRAVGDSSLGHSEVRYAATGGSAQRHHIEGLPLGTRGGIAVEHTFPLDAEYEFTVNAFLPVAGWENPTGQLVWCNGPSVDVAFNGAPVEIDERRRFRLRVPAGPQRITAALVDERRCAGVNELYLGEIELGGAIAGVTIDGPYAATGVGDTPSRRAIFDCKPATAADERPCAETTLARLATRAYRQPIGASSNELRPLMDFYALGRKEGGDFDVGIQYALSRLLVDPHFLYRFESEPKDIAVGAVYRIGDLELASRLSFFLWSSIPDDELLAAAAAHQLRDPATLTAQIDRMLADPRSQRFVENFAGQWLKLRELTDFPSQDPDLDADLRAAFRRETELFFADVLRERRSALTLLDADFSYLNDRLAEHYGIEGVHDSYMRRVSLPPDSPRRGLLGKGSLLTTTSAPNRTSPVVRGQWIMQSLLGAAVPSPPPGAAADLSKEASAVTKLVGNTVRERLEMHRANPTCATCHAMMDPIGLSLENFDLVGRWREQEDGHPINATSEMTDGTPLASPTDLQRALLSRGNAFVTALTERLMTYALGRELEYYDEPVVRSVIREAAVHGTTLPALIHAIVTSDAFQKRMKIGAATTATADSATGSRLVAREAGTE